MALDREKIIYCKCTRSYFPCVFAHLVTVNEVNSVISVILSTTFYPGFVIDTSQSD